MDRLELKANIEAIIFVSEEPINEKQIHAIFEGTEVNFTDIKEVLESIIEETNNNTSRGLQIVKVAGGYQFRTKEISSQWIQKLSVPKPTKLSQPALETLSIVAYRQPIVRSEIEEIRGVDVGGVLKTLLDKELISIVGRRDEAGQPLIYGTTDKFLEIFGINAIKDLPPLTDIEELAKRNITNEEPQPLTITPIDDQDTNFEENESGYEDQLNTGRSEDKEVLENIEQSLKDLRQLEREIFPKEEKKEETQSILESNEENNKIAETDSQLH